MRPPGRRGRGAAGPIEVRGNRHLLSQALANLVDNAVKYTPAGGTVTIAVHPPTEGSEADGAEVVVADSGPGIPEVDRERVFDRFVRLEASRHTPGSGLGLSLVRAVARLHRAGLTLEDASPGLRVRLRFPHET
ncbi:MAG: sensor histidine kinase [Alphaproteobacteria bacterium]